MSDSSQKSVASGEKFRNAQGIAAIKDGQKRRNNAEPQVFSPKPKWLRVKHPAEIALKRSSATSANTV